MTIAALDGDYDSIFDDIDTPAVHARLRRRVSRRVRHWAISIAGALAIAGGASATFLYLRPAPKPVPVANVATPVWREISHPLQFYRLESAEFGREPRLYEARGNSSGGRLDILSFGPAVPVREPNLRLSIYRIGGEEAPDERFYVAMAHGAAAANLSISHSAQPGEMATRFGAFEVADVVLSNGREENACLGFRFGVDTPGLRMAGFACGAPAKPIDRRTLACALNRLDLAAGGGDRELIHFFATAEKARGTGCGGARTPSAKAGWLDGAVGKPALRSDVAVQKTADK